MHLPKLAHLVHFLPGGFERQTLLLVQLLDDGHDLSLVCQHRPLLLAQVLILQGPDVLA